MGLMLSVAELAGRSDPEVQRTFFDEMSDVRPLIQWLRRNFYPKVGLWSYEDTITNMLGAQATPVTVMNALYHFMRREVRWTAGDAAYNAMPADLTFPSSTQQQQSADPHSGASFQTMASFRSIDQRDVDDARARLDSGRSGIIGALAGTRYSRAPFKHALFEMADTLRMSMAASRGGATSAQHGEETGPSEFTN